MKKYILISVMLFTSLSGFSQKKSHLGIKGGYIASTTNNKEFNSNLAYLGRRSFSAGICYNTSIAKVFDFQLEALYSRKGYTNFYTYKADFIEMPIILKVHANGGKIKPFLNTGISPSLNIIDNSNSFQSFDLGFISSVGIDIPIKECYTFIELRYSLGLLGNHSLNLTDNAGNPIIQSNEKNNSFYVSTGLFF
jgi:hypothetical protein